MPALLAEERGNHPADEHLSSTRLLRRRMLRGELVSVVMPGKSRSFVSQAVTVMKRLGFEFEASGPGEERVFRVTNPEHEPTEEQYRQASHPTGVRVEHVKVLKGQTLCSCGAKLKTTDSLRKHVARKPGHRPVDEQPEAPPTARSVERKRVEAAAHDEMLPVPNLGQHLKVFLLMEEEDGSLRIGLRNGTRSWVGTLDGMTERTPA